MGVFCCGKRKPDHPAERDRNSFLSYYKKEDLNFNDEAVVDGSLQEFYTKAVKEESIELLMKLITNETKITIEGKLNISSWLPNPENIGDLSVIRILNIIQKKIKEIEENEKLITELLTCIKETNMVSRMLSFLESCSNIKKDVSILILSEISSDKNLLSLINYKEVILKLIIHANCILSYRPKNYYEHIIASLQILRRIYVTNIIFRRCYLDNGGMQLLYQCFSIEDCSIVQEALYNIEDLIYMDDDVADLHSVSKMLIREMVDILIKLNIEKMLMELFQETQKNSEKTEYLGQDIKRLLIVFGSKLNFEK